MGNLCLRATFPQGTHVHRTWTRSLLGAVPREARRAGGQVRKAYCRLL